MEVWPALWATRHLPPPRLPVGGAPRSPGAPPAGGWARGGKRGAFGEARGGEAREREDGRQRRRMVGTRWEHDEAPKPAAAGPPGPPPSALSGARRGSPPPSSPPVPRLPALALALAAAVVVRPVLVSVRGGSSARRPWGGCRCVSVAGVGWGWASGVAAAAARGGAAPATSSSSPSVAASSAVPWGATRSGEAGR